MKIAIVGFGATGVSFLVQLIDSIKNKSISVIFIIDKKELLVGGRAFVSLNDEHILNTPSSLMSCYVDDENHFIDWLAQNNIDTFYPARKIFKNYLMEQFNKIIHKAKIMDIKVEIIDDYALEVVKKDNIFFLKLKNNSEQIVVDKIIYTSGEPSKQATFFKSNLLLFDNGVSLPEIEVNKNGEVMILGSGISAIDAIFSLNKYDDVKQIHSYSRKGLLPTIFHKNPNDISNALPPMHFTKSNLEKLIKNNKFNLKSVLNLIYKDLKLYKTSELADNFKYLSDSNTKEYYESVLPMAKNNNLPFQYLLRSSRHYFTDLWIKASLKQKQEFHKFERYFIAFRYSIPYENGKKLFELLKCNKLKIFKIDNIQYNKNDIVVVNTNDNLIRTYPMGINTITANYDIKNSGSSFDKSLIKNNIAQACEIMGIKVNPLNCMASDGFYIAGQLVKGTFYSTNSFWFNQKLGSLIVKDILGK